MCTLDLIAQWGREEVGRESTSCQWWGLTSCRWGGRGFCAAGSLVDPRLARHLWFLSSLNSLPNPTCHLQNHLGMSGLETGEWRLRCWCSFFPSHLSSIFYKHQRDFSVKKCQEITSLLQGSGTSLKFHSETRATPFPPLHGAAVPETTLSASENPFLRSPFSIFSSDP